MIFSHIKILSIILHPLPQFPFNRIAKAKGVAFSKSCRFYLLNMEESLPVQSKETMSPLNTVQDPIPPHDNTKKRKQCDVDIRNSAYFKILHLVQHLRPHFIEIQLRIPKVSNGFKSFEARAENSEHQVRHLPTFAKHIVEVLEVLQTPDFRHCKPSYEIRKRMKLVMDLYKHMQVVGNPIGNYESKSASQILPGEKKLEKEHLDGLLQSNSILNKLPEKELPPEPLRSGENFNNGRPKGSYIVGGSVSGWNFITFAHRNPPVYYGVTKESYRLGHSMADKNNFA